MVNEVRFGMSGGATLFSPGLDSGHVERPARQPGRLRPGHRAASAAWRQSGTRPDPAAASARARRRRSSSRDTLNWLKGAHSISIGVHLHAGRRLAAHRDARAARSTSACRPATRRSRCSARRTSRAARSAQRNAARDLYAVLTGRVSAISGTARLDAEHRPVRLQRPEPPGRPAARGRPLRPGQLEGEAEPVAERSACATRCSCRSTPSSTTATRPRRSTTSGASPATSPGAIRAIATPETCNLFKPGVHAGHRCRPTRTSASGVKRVQHRLEQHRAERRRQLDAERRGRLAAARSSASRATRRSRPAGARAFERHGMSDFTGVFGDNPGLTVTANRNADNGNLGAAAAAPAQTATSARRRPAPAPVTAACIPVAPVYPIAATTTGSVNIFDPNLQVPYSDTWTVGLQRALGRRSAFEVRYIGTRNREQWTSLQLQRGEHPRERLPRTSSSSRRPTCTRTSRPDAATTFAYFGAGHRHEPAADLPGVLQRHADGAGAASAPASRPARRCTRRSFSNSNFVNPLSRFNPNPFTPAGTNANTGLQGSARAPHQRANARACRGNFFLANPDVLGGAQRHRQRRVHELQRAADAVPPPALAAACSST